MDTRHHSTPCVFLTKAVGSSGECVPSGMWKIFKPGTTLASSVVIKPDDTTNTPTIDNDPYGAMKWIEMML